MWTTTTQNRVWLTTLIGVIDLDRVESIAVRAGSTVNQYDVVAYITGSSTYYPIVSGFKTTDEALEKIEEIMKSMVHTGENHE